MHRSAFAAVVLGLWIALFPSVPWAEEADFSAYERLLKRHVRPAMAAGIRLHVVDYPEWRRDPDHPRALAALAGFDTATLTDRSERLAFWINAYNLLAIATVIDTGVTESIKDAGSWLNPVWEQDAGVVGGGRVTLNQVEHQILRPLGEPRIHFAIVCASRSCPDLRPEAFVADRIDQQLAEQTRAFLTNDTKGLAIRNGRLTVSRIFDWFEDDFEASGGVPRFIRANAPAPIPEGARIQGYFNYDWSLNQAP